MKKHILFIFLLQVFGNSLFGQKQEEQAVKSAFEKYRADILNDLGEEAFKDVDSRTVKYYGDLLEWIKNSDSLEVEALSVLDKMSVLMIRNKMPKEDLLAMDGKQLFIYAVNEGMVGKGSVSILAFDKLIADSGKSENEFLIPLIEASISKKMNPESWKPLQ